MTSHPDRIESVLAAEADWLNAHQRTDRQLLDRLMHRDYAIISPNGGVIKRAEALASYVPGERVWDFAQSDQHQVKIYGNTAIVLGRWRAQGTNNGQPFDYAARYVSVWIWEDDRWQMLSDQSTPISE